MSVDLKNNINNIIEFRNLPPYQIIFHAIQKKNKYYIQSFKQFFLIAFFFVFGIFFILAAFPFMLNNMIYIVIPSLIIGIGMLIISCIILFICTVTGYDWFTIYPDGESTIITNNNLHCYYDDRYFYLDEKNIIAISLYLNNKIPINNKLKKFFPSICYSGKEYNAITFVQIDNNIYYVEATFYYNRVTLINTVKEVKSTYGEKINLFS